MKAIQIVLPEGDLTELAMLHITKGHAIMCNKVGVSQPHLFMTSSGSSFVASKAALNYWWGTALGGRWCHKLPQWTPQFAPSKGRTMYVEHVTALTGNTPAEWDGAAQCMGSSAKQWSLHYAPGMRARQMQAAADNHHMMRHDDAKRSKLGPATATLTMQGACLPALVPNVGKKDQGGAPLPASGLLQQPHAASMVGDAMCGGGGDGACVIDLSGDDN